MIRADATGIELVRLSDYRGDMAAVERLPEGHWPGFLFHTAATVECWHLLAERFADCQLAMLDAAGELVGLINTVPFAMDERALADRQDGWDGVLRAGTAPDAPAPDTLSALSVLIVPAHRRPGAADLAIGAMKQIAAERGLRELVAPVRPTLKPRYVLTPFERYVTWRGPDGLPFDPWVRRHVRLGGVVVGPCMESMVVEGSVADWERWSDMALPASGRYVVSGALEPIDVDRERDAVRYVEPNLWIRHALR